MHVRVKLFATLGEFSPGGGAGQPFELNMREGATVQEVIDHLGLPEESVHVLFVNGRARPRDWKLTDGDEIGIFPPIGGG